MTEKVFVQDAADDAIYHREVPHTDSLGKVHWQTACGQPIRFNQYTVRVPVDMAERVGIPCQECY